MTFNRDLILPENINLIIQTFEIDRNGSEEKFLI